MDGDRGHRFTTCYIAAPRGTDTIALRSVLEDRGVIWSDAFSLEPSGPTLLDSIERAILEADFVCVAIPVGEPTATVYFETGLAFAHRRPLLLLIEPEANVPLDLQGLVAVRVHLDDPRVLELPLDLFLQNAQDRLVRLNGYRRPRVTPIDVAEVRLALQELRGSDTNGGPRFEQLVARLFEQAGAIVAMPGGGADRGVDMAIGITELQSSIGNPILVEAKYGNLTRQQITETVAQLQTYAASVEAAAALLVYWDREGKSFPAESNLWPPVMVLSALDLAEIISQGRLANYLIHSRNLAAHGLA
jgi:hypothetical protein